MGTEPDAVSLTPNPPIDRAKMRRRFREFSDVVSKFSHEVAPSPDAGPAISNQAELNLQVTKTIFGKWSLEILVMLYTMKFLGFEQIRRSLEGISHRVLSEKLKQLEAKQLIRRRVLSTRPPRVNYSLTEKGLIIARLGEPVFLFLRYEEGFDPELK
ncbi:MAG: helix-turn-helix transcriptional regulator [archaeon]|nr:MAG: helix-turn-helix transcriptional regulator [archaeon]